MSALRSIPGRCAGGARSLAAAALAALLLAGCSGNPLSPAGDATTGTGASAGPEVLVVAADGTVSYVPASIATALPAGTLSGADRSLLVSTDIDGSIGGTLRCGRFLLDVPAGAFDGKGTVTMRMRDSTVMVVDVDIAPADLNGFKTPVALAVTTIGTEVAADTLGMYWYDPVKSYWTGLACSKDLLAEPTLVQEVEDAGAAYTTTSGGDATRGLWAPLSHFSRYSAGKAGW